MEQKNIYHEITSWIGRIKKERKKERKKRNKKVCFNSTLGIMSDFVMKNGASVNSVSINSIRAPKNSLSFMNMCFLLSRANL